MLRIFVATVLVVICLASFGNHDRQLDPEWDKYLETNAPSRKETPAEQPSDLSLAPKEDSEINIPAKEEIPAEQPLHLSLAPQKEGEFSILHAPENATIDVSGNVSAYLSNPRFKDGATLRIPQGMTATYDISDANVRLKSIDVRGELIFSRSKSTELIVESIGIESGGTLLIGTDNTDKIGTIPSAINQVKRLPNEFNSQITFAPVSSTNRVIDETTDLTQLGRGLISASASTVRIYGEKKTPYATLSGLGASRGSKVLKLSQLPEDWRVGDHLVVTGTSLNKNGRNSDNSKFQDEEIRIASIDRQANAIRFTNLDMSGSNNSSLRFDHRAPDDRFEVYVANLTRNITFETEAGKNAKIKERGHIMFMSHDVEVSGAAFNHLGRNDKRKVSSFDASGNRKGRYPLHFHRALSEGCAPSRSQECPMEVLERNYHNARAFDERYESAESYDAVQALVENSSVWGSPGWSYVLHSSSGIFRDNVAFDAVGAHYVTEDGDEIGIYSNNIAIKATGDIQDKPADLLQLDKNHRGQARDIAVRGNGFWFDTPYSSYRVDGNIATSTKDSGYVWYGQNDREKAKSEFNAFSGGLNTKNGLANVPTSALPDPLKFLARGEDVVPAWWILNQDNWKNNTAYNVGGGVEIRGLRRNDTGTASFVDNAPLAKSWFDGLKIWETRTFGVEVSYSAHVGLKNSIIVARKGTDRIKRKSGVGDSQGFGIFLNKNVRGVAFVNNQIEGFSGGLVLNQHNGQGLNLENESTIDPAGAPILVGGTYRNNTINFVAMGGRYQNPSRTPPISIGAPYALWARIQGLDPSQMDIGPNNQYPIAEFKAAVNPQGTVDVDGLMSKDPDYDAVDAYGNSNSIASFIWDFDNDGMPDAFGYKASYQYPPKAANMQKIRLIVVDGMGAASTTTTDVNISQPSASVTSPASQAPYQDRLPIIDDLDVEYYPS